MIAKKPSTLRDLDAASVPAVAATAWQALFEQARVTRGQTVLVLDAPGNVGAYAVQLARWAGVRVIATARAKNVAYVRSLGADEVIGCGVAHFEDVDAVIDLVGGEVQARSFAVPKRGGALISAVSPPIRHLPPSRASTPLSSWWMSPPSGSPASPG